MKRALHRAAADGDNSKVRRLLAEGAAIDERDDDGYTPLMIACIHGQHITVRALCVAGAALHVLSSDQRDAISYAAVWGAKSATATTLDWFRQRQARCRAAIVVLVGCMRRWRAPRDMRLVLGRLVWQTRRQNEWV